MTLRLHVLLPAILMLVCLADGITRAMPVTMWSFRAWEPASAHHPTGTPFEPSARYTVARASGDLANMGNLRALRVYRRETVTTDAYGLRNPPGIAESGDVSVLLFGDSFAAGAGNSDDFTLSAQLTGTSRRTTYSLAPALPDAASLTAFIRHVKMTPGGWVVHQQAYAYNESHAGPLEPTRYPPVTMIDRARISYEDRIWPLRILVNRAWRFVENDVLLPNPYRGVVQRARLRNGDEMLFLAGHRFSDEVTPDLAGAVADSVRYAQTLADRAHAHGLRYVVVLVPLKPDVYRHLLVGAAPPEPREPGASAEMERQLRAAGIPVVNLFAEFSARAAMEAERHQYLYWPDDTHWSPLGIAIAARAIARAMAETPTHAP